MSRGGDTRFKKGHSGNPTGRPRKTKVDAGESAFQVIFDQTVTVTEGGNSRTLSAEEALQLKTYQEAIKGSRIAQRAIMKMITRREAWIVKHKKPAVRKIALKRTYRDRQGHALKAMLVLGIASQPDGDTEPLLEPWAFDAALARPRSPRLDRLTRARMRVSVRDWPSTKWREHEADDGN